MSVSSTLCDPCGAPTGLLLWRTAPIATRGSPKSAQNQIKLTDCLEDQWSEYSRIHEGSFLGAFRLSRICDVPPRTAESSSLGLDICIPLPCLLRLTQAKVDNSNSNNPAHVKFSQQYIPGIG